MMIAVTILLTVACLLWLGNYLALVAHLHHLDVLEQLDVEDPDQWPSVSIVIPACNEAETIEPALESVLALDYPDLEIVVVDDRSTDGTGEIVDRLAADDERVEAIHVEELPDQWLGKTHALHRGTRAAGGDWLLYTDADVVYESGVLRRCMAVALADDADHLTCLPWMHADSFLEETALAAFSLAMFSLAGGRAVEDPESDAFIGVGAFNLVKRSSFERTEGWEWLRMEVADDVGLGMMLAEYDMKTRVLMSRDLLQLEWYPSTRAMIRGLEKNAFPAIARYSLVRAIGFFGVWCLVFFGPIAALFHPSAWLTGMGAVAIGASLPVHLYGASVLGRSPGPFLAVPIGQWLLMYVFLRSTYVCLRRGGVEWRGTTYPIEELRRHQRLRL